MELIPVRVFQNYFTAHILLSRLKSAGITCFLSDETLVSVSPFLSSAVGGVKLMVRDVDFEEVSALLKKWEEEYQQTAACPRCGSHNVNSYPRKTTMNLLIVIVSWLLGNLAISAGKDYICSYCGHLSETFPENMRCNVQISPEQLN